MSEKSNFYYKVLELVLEDYDPLRNHTAWGKSIAQSLGTPERADEILDLLNDSTFRADVLNSRRDLAAASIEIIKRHLVGLTLKQLSLAESTDQRTAFQATKDLLDRGGTGAITKLAINSPAMYREAVKDLLEDEPEKKDDAPD